MKLHLKVDPEDFTVDDLIGIEEGTISTRKTRDLVAKCLVDENTNRLDPDEARAIIGKLNLRELKEVGQQMGAAMTRAIKEMVPTETASE